MKKTFVIALLFSAFSLFSIEAHAQFNIGNIKEKVKDALSNPRKNTGSNAPSTSSSNNGSGESRGGGNNSSDNWGETKIHVLDQIRTARQEFESAGTVESGILDKTGYATDDDAFKWFLHLNYTNDPAVQKEAKERLLSYYNLYNPNGEFQSVPANILQELEAAAASFRADVTKAGTANKFSQTKPSTVNKEANAVKAYLTGNKHTLFKVIEVKSWEINKNELGIPNYRQKTLVVHYKPAGTSYCVERGAVVRENYSGGGTYETSNPDVVMWGFAKLVGCQ